MKKQIFILILLLGCSSPKADLRIGFSPNLTHGQALIALAQNKFQNGLESKDVSFHQFHAGPSIIEALFAEAIDVAYVGPIPAINSYVRSNGKFVVVAGAANGGGALVVAKESQIRSLDQIEGVRLATPQLGNTQDVTARSYFSEKRNISFTPVSHPDQINLFRRREVEVAWSIEPWVSRLIEETEARILLDEAQVWKEWNEESYPTTVIVARKSYIEMHPDLIKKFLETHVELTQWINQNPKEAQALANEKIAHLIGKPLSDEVLSQAWNRIQFIWTLKESGLKIHADNAQKIGFLRGNKPKWDQFFESYNAWKTNLN